MSTSGGHDGDDSFRRRSSAHPAVAAVCGAVLLASDPSLALAVQQAALQAVPAEPPALMLTAAATPGEQGLLKDLLGEVRRYRHASRRSRARFAITVDIVALICRPCVAFSREGRVDCHISSTSPVYRGRAWALQQ